jgi:hypothetical protein
MKFSSRQRWIVYAVAAAGTGAAMWAVDHQPPADAELVRPARGPLLRTSVTPSARANASAADALQALERRLHASTNSTRDPFADGGGVPAIAAASTPAVAAAPVPPPVPRAPALPFTYVGRWEENGQTIIYLLENGQVFPVRGPGPLDERYAVQSVSADALVLKYLPIGEEQTLALVRAAGGGSAAGGTPAGDSGTTTTNPQEDN